MSLIIFHSKMTEKYFVFSNVLLSMISIKPKGDDINGILHQYSSINATCEVSSYKDDIALCINAIDVTKNYHFCSGNEEGSWFLFHVPNIKIFVTHYSLEMPERVNSYWYYPKSWSLYSISDKNEEQQISHVQSAQFDPIISRIKTFELDEKGFYSKFRLEMEGDNDGGQNELRIYKIDLFGKIYQFFYFGCGKKSYHFRTFSLSILFLYQTTD